MVAEGLRSKLSRLASVRNVADLMHPRPLARRAVRHNWRTIRVRDSIGSKYIRRPTLDSSSSSCSYVRCCQFASIRSSAAYLHEMMLHCCPFHALRPVIARRVQVVCKVPEGVLYLLHSTCIHVPLLQSPRRPLVQPDTHAITLRCTATSLAQLPCCLHTRPAGAARFAFAGLAHVLPTCPAARAGLAGLDMLCRALCLTWLLGHLFAFPLRPRPRPQIAFSLWLLATSSGAGTIARGNIHIASSLPRPIYTRQVEGSKTRDPLA
jgi:hypothetical protein